MSKALLAFMFNSRATFFYCISCAKFLMWPFDLLVSCFVEDGSRNERFASVILDGSGCKVAPMPFYGLKFSMNFCLAIEATCFFFSLDNIVVCCARNAKSFRFASEYSASFSSSTLLESLRNGAIMPTVSCEYWYGGCMFANASRSKLAFGLCYSNPCSSNVTAYAASCSTLAPNSMPARFRRYYSSNVSGFAVSNCLLLALKTPTVLSLRLARISRSFIMF